MVTTTATRQSILNAISKVFAGQSSKLDTANKYLEKYLNDLPTLYNKLGNLAGGVDFFQLVALHNASPTSQAVKAEIADALIADSKTSSDITYQARIGNTGTQLSTDASNLTDATNELVNFLAVLTEGGTYQYPYTGGTLTYNQMSAGANLVGTMLSSGAKITGTQLSAGAGILGSQLASTARIVGTQLSQGTLTNSQISAGTNIVGTQLSAGAGILGSQILTNTIHSTPHFH